MSITINRSIDIEDEVRSALSDYMTVYCRPLPKDFEKPSILVQRVGGSDINTIDTFEVVLDSRADTEYDADLLLRDAIGVLKKVAENQTTALRYVQVNSSGSWGADPARPDLAMCSARLSIVAHQETAIITEV